jgi:hypothetical protein
MGIVYRLTSQDTEVTFTNLLALDSIEPFAWDSGTGRARSHNQHHKHASMKLRSCMRMSLTAIRFTLTEPYSEIWSSLGREDGAPAFIRASILDVPPEDAAGTVRFS